MQKFSFLRGWVAFLSKKKTFFSCKISDFAGLGALFGTFFCHFFVIFSCKISVFWEAGRSFWVKKNTFFHAKLKFLRGWMLFLSTKTTVKAVERGGRRGASRGAILCATSLFRSSLPTSYSPGSQKDTKITKKRYQKYHPRKNWSFARKHVVFFTQKGHPPSQKQNFCMKKWQKID